MDMLEKFQFYNITKANNQINDRNTVTQNILFDNVLQTTTSRGHPENLAYPECLYLLQLQSNTLPVQ